MFLKLLWTAVLMQLDKKIPGKPMTQTLQCSSLFDICKICKTKDLIMDVSSIKQGKYDVVVKWSTIDFKSSKYLLLKFC